LETVPSDLGVNRVITVVALVGYYRTRLGSDQRPTVAAPSSAAVSLRLCEDDDLALAGIRDDMSREADQDEVSLTVSVKETQQAPPAPVLRLLYAIHMVN
jgi:hypothetical protein